MLKHQERNSGAPQVFEHEYYQRLYELEEGHWWSVGMRSMVQGLLNPLLQGRQDLRILDAGCGTGGMLSWLKRYADPQRIVGIDLSRYALRFCQKRQLGQLVQVSITELPFPSESFDLVTCFDVLQHLPRDGADREALRECRRVLKPGGLLYLRTNARPRPAAGSGKPQDEASEPRDYHQYVRQELVEILSETGLDVQRATYANMLTALIRDWMRRLNPFHSREGVGNHNPGLVMRVPPAGINAIMKLVMLWEAWYLAGPKRTLPYGHALICLAAKSPFAGTLEKSRPDALQ